MLISRAFLLFVQTREAAVSNLCWRGKQTKAAAPGAEAAEGAASDRGLHRTSFGRNNSGTGCCK